MPSTTKIYKKWNRAAEHHQFRPGSTACNAECAITQEDRPSGSQIYQSPESRNWNNLDNICSRVRYSRKYDVGTSEWYESSNFRYDRRSLPTHGLTIHRFKTCCDLLFQRQKIGMCSTWLGTQHDIAGSGRADSYFRASTRKRRLTALRITALPTALETAKPTRRPRIAAESSIMASSCTK